MMVRLINGIRKTYKFFHFSSIPKVKHYCLFQENPIYNINLFVLQGIGDFTWMVSDWWRHLRKYLSRHKCFKLLYVSKWGGQWTPHPSELLHLNQASVQHLISDLTDAQASAFWHGHKCALDLRAGLIDTYMDTYLLRGSIPLLFQPYPLFLQ